MSNQTAVPVSSSLVKTDSLFYRLFQDHPDLVFQLIGDNAPRTDTYAFGAQEVKQLSFRLDGILNPPLDAVDLPIVFVEVQGYPDRQRTLYHSFFAEILLYLRDYQPTNDWLGMLIFTRGSLAPRLPLHCQDYAKSDRFQRVYLDELPIGLANQSLALDVLQLISVADELAPERARQLVARARAEVADGAEHERVVGLVLTTVVYKFPTLEREAIRQMLGLDELKQTRFYQEIAEEERVEGRKEGREEVFALVIPGFLEQGLTVEQIAVKLRTDVPTVGRIVQRQRQAQA